MEPRQSLILYVRTSDKVLLRFSDLETARAWLEARRLSPDAEYLAIDQTWQPLNRLFRIDLPPPGPAPDKHPAPTGAPAPEAVASAASSPAPDPEQIPTVPFFPSSLSSQSGDAGSKWAGQPHQGTAFETPAAREGPTRVSVPPSVETVRLARPAEPPRIRGIERGSAWEPDLWGSEPDATRSHGRRLLRRMVGAFAIVGLVVVVGAVAWFLYDHSSRDVRDSLVVARTEPAVPVAVPAPQPPAEPQSGGPGPDATAVSAASAPDPGPSADAGPSVASAPPAVAEPPPPPPAPEPPAVPEKRPEPRPVAAPPPSGPSPAVSRVSDDLNYDQHMAEGLRWLGRDPRKALAHFQAAARQRPGSVEPKVKMAECEFRAGRYREAAALFQQAMDASPNYGPAIAGLARAHARLGNAKDARFLYMKYLDVNPNGSQAPEARAYLGR